jgi:hypothetical protein
VKSGEHLVNTDEEPSRTKAEADNITYLKIGDPITIGHFAYSVNGIEFVKSIGTDSYSKATADGIFLVVDLTLKNFGDEAHMLDDSFYKLTDVSGTEYSTAGSDVMLAMSMIGKETLFLKEVNPNIQKKGYLVFEVPEKDTYDLHLSGGFWTGKTLAVRLIP